jgi:hypothetical protein
LASTKTNDLAVERVAYAVRLCVLERNGGYGKITQSRLWQRTRVLGNHDRVEGLRRHDLRVVAVLSEVDTKDRPCLLRSWDEVWVDLEDEVFASLLLLKDFKCLVRISRSNDAV